MPFRVSALFHHRSDVIGCHQYSQRHWEGGAQDNVGTGAEVCFDAGQGERIKNPSILRQGSGQARSGRTEKVSHKTGASIRPYKQSLLDPELRSGSKTSKKGTGNFSRSKSSQSPWNSMPDVARRAGSDSAGKNRSDDHLTAPDNPPSLLGRILG